MLDDFVIARNPEPDSTLPYLLRVPLGERGIVLKARETWPRTAKVYCHRAVEWPADAEIVERTAVRSCIRRGAAIDLVLDRGRENRSQFVLTRIRGGREAIFWQSPRTTKQARPNVGLPTGRAQGIRALDIVVDVHERYPYRFAHQQVRTERARLPAGDYAVRLDGDVVAAVERKSVADLSASLLTGRLRFALTELASLPRAAVVVEDRYSAIFKIEHARPAAVADALAEHQVRFPTVPIAFCDTRPLAEERTYRYLAAALAELATDAIARDVPLPEAGLLAPAEPSTAQMRVWAVEHGWPVSDRGRLAAEVVEAFRQWHDA
ncbi:MAG: ERCC4 domain-containing protein [Jiangellaceae bacterium]